MSKNPLHFFRGDFRRRSPCRRYLELEDRPRRLPAQIFSLLTLSLGVAYLIWLGALVQRNQDGHGYLFWMAEALVFLLLALLAFDLRRLRHHRPEGLEVDTPWPVDIFVPCCGEPLEVIRTTLRAVSRINYQPVQVYVLDDAGSSQVAFLAESLGFRYCSRPLAGLSRQDSKSGNLNFALHQSQGELILVLDADQVPAPDILSRLVGFFRRPEVGYVASRQTFCLPEGDPFYNRDEIFYGAIQPANDQANTVMSCGSGVVYRRRALTEIRGFPSWNIVEDFTTSYELVSHGWRGIYFPYALSRGLAPLSLHGVYRQRFQWSLDTMRLFFWDNPLKKSGLTWSQKLHFLLIMISYLVGGLVFPVFYFMPLLSYWRGYSIFQGYENQYLLWRGAYLAAMILMFHYLFKGKDPFKQFKVLCGLFPVYAAAIFAALLYPPGRKPPYYVNNSQIFSEFRRWWCVLPQLAVIFLHFALPFHSLSMGWAPPKLILFNAFFSGFIIYVLADLVLAGLREPQWPLAMDPRRIYGF
jgi:cellulose synthase (UDP-forming)